MSTRAGASRATPLSTAEENLVRGQLAHEAIQRGDWSTAAAWAKGPDAATFALAHLFAEAEGMSMVIHGDETSERLSAADTAAQRALGSLPVQVSEKTRAAVPLLPVRHRPDPAAHRPQAPLE